MSRDAAYILIADDDPDDQEMLAERFLRLNPRARVEAVANGYEALSFLRDRHPGELPQLIVVDYKMPVLTGYDFLQAIKDNPRYAHIPKVVWSTSKNREYADKCRQSGALEYFTKPHDVKGLDKVVEEISELFRTAG